MLDIYDSETLVKVYRLLIKKCNAIDKFIKNHAFYFGPSTNEYDALDVYNNIIDLMERKNQLINLKIILDKAINSLKEKDKKIIYIKTFYNLPMTEICEVLSLKERTAFRRIEGAYYNLAEALNSSKYLNKLESILEKEEWIREIRDQVKSRRMAFKAECDEMVSNL